ncbi:methylated-DNA-[protein]-cysteine S-methyltransferase [Breznakia blatticola]|uniref:methylated-DNA--[protein]-cysteine S-methyltransferase n=1 Tax=Breznakia blatticola TaxID=1754012 RepID=A0A4R8A5B1_9FIRM|nr:methylated-DNA--[protein]-cysteine S-methyltransferase [Breznakia blatticola]TDW24911.1 methylated-DNA-[protein]-cysteine S-methyltransferase [Breznakia blatticola]
MYCANYESPLGIYRMISDGQALIGLDRMVDATDILNQFEYQETLPIFQKTRAWLDAYFRKENPSIDALHIQLHGTAFQKEVWDVLLDVKYGSVATYGDLAKILAKRRNIKRMSSQAVGNALGKNPIPIIVPCHRVIGTKDNLVGYTGGLHIKTFLLELEGIDITKLHKPKS